ncbi:autotransporter outer membrane beta-barrel domain-containing protein [Parahaliea aestuarii]|uniref:Autotransporter outer membrane beta-barrel domain-containing protein n=1 Tax=Parahaliea aestuarii TaxID=1852021 RepID=A0A5C8ZPY7_9GAMM|nr:autotransporter outer membrane beta-barrel domain-containing protein [Parahaliea aestuarii]TXS90546.1 autotransporter outer membrane beta-barrel domain-containing protein [Parahaliea aestuarii]
METRFRDVRLYLMIPLAGLAMPLAAQDTTLGQVVAGAPGSTALQVVTGEAVQNTCGELAGTYRPVIGANRPATTPEEDLFFRCNEMVQTANLLNGNPDAALNNLGWTSGQLAEAMQQLTGEEQVSKGRLATESSNGQFAHIGMRLDAIRAGARATASGLRLALNDAPVVGGNAGEEGESPWSWFVNGAYGNGDRDATAREDQYDYDAYGATLGVDYLLDSGAVVGVALGYSDYEVDFDSSGSPLPMNDLTSRVAGGGFSLDGYAVSAYAIGNIGRFYVDGLVSYGMNDYDTERRVSYRGSSSGGNRGQNLVVNRAMSGSTDSDSLGVGVSTGTQFELGVVDLALDVGLSYLDVTVDGYTEREQALAGDESSAGGLALAYEDQDFESLQSSLGFQFSRPFSTQSGVILPYLGAAWRHEFRNDADTVAARYAAQQTGQTFNLTIGSDDPDEDYFELGLGVSAVFANRITAFVDYSTTLGLEDVSASLFTIGVRGSF